ncbi:MAG: hypothetical protein ABIN48_05250 [Ginsengibacter sp.]
MNKFIKKSLKVIFSILALLLAGYVFLIVYIHIHKEEILTKATNKIETEINGQVTIGDIGLSFFKKFPRISVFLNNVEVIDEQFHTHQKPFFKGKDVFVYFDVFTILQKRFSVKGVEIDQANFYVYTDSTGYSNGYLFKPKEDTAGTNTSGIISKLVLKNVVLKDVDVTIDDGQKQKLYDFHTEKLAVKINDSDSSTMFTVKARLIINKLLFAPGSNGILKNQKVEGNFDLLYDKQLMELHTDSMDLKIGGQPFNLNFTIDMKTSAPKFQIKVNKGSIPLADVKSFLNNTSN